MFTVTLDGLDALTARLEAMPDSIDAALAAKAADLSQKLQAHVVQDKLSGQVLQAKTGALRDSISVELTTDGDAVQARIFSAGDIKYAAIQEYGGQTAPHDIVPDKAKALAFVVGGRTVFAKIVHHPGSKIPERSYLRSALADMADEITAEFESAVVESLQA